MWIDLAAAFWLAHGAIWAGTTILTRRPLAAGWSSAEGVRGGLDRSYGVQSFFAAAGVAGRMASLLALAFLGPAHPQGEAFCAGTPGWLRLGAGGIQLLGAVLFTNGLIGMKTVHDCADRYPFPVHEASLMRINAGIALIALVSASRVCG